MSRGATIGYGCQSTVATLRRVLVRPPGAAFAAAEPARWHYRHRPDLAAARKEHEALVEILEEEGCEVHFHDAELPELADSIYVYDPVLITERGTVALRMGKALRRGEEAPLEARLEALGVPTFFRLEDHGGDPHAEGGDLLWLDRSTLVAGLGFRTDRAGVDALRAGLSPLGVEVLETELPYHTGPEACLHLTTPLSLLDDDLAVLYPPLLSVPFHRLLAARGIRVVEVPDEEYATMATNVLALGPRRGLMLEGNPVTRRRLEAAGCAIRTYRGDEISLNAEGGPTCLTRPILRA